MIIAVTSVHERKVRVSVSFKDRVRVISSKARLFASLFSAVFSAVFNAVDSDWLALSHAHSLDSDWLAARERLSR